MTREEAIAILENEKKCVNRANKNDYCNRDCYNCELVKTDTEILTALDMAIAALSTNTRPNRHARWVEVNDKLLCSCCSQGNVMNYKYPFCHWCGADMRGDA